MKSTIIFAVIVNLLAATVIGLDSRTRTDEETAILTEPIELAVEYTSSEENTPPPEPEHIFTAYDAELIGRTIWGEAEGVQSKAERAAVAWCVLNRVDARGVTIEEAVTARKQFQGYRPADQWGECPQEHIELAMDVLLRWEAEKNGAENVGRVLPAEYQYFMGDGERNHFTVEYLGTDAWDWSMASPY